MEILRRIGLPGPKTASRGEVVTNQELVIGWEEAFLGKGLFQYDRYAAVLARRDDPSKKVYSSVNIDPSRVSIDIPLTEHTPEEELLQQAYKTTFFGEVDQEKFQAFATDDFTTGKLLAFLNRKIAGVSPEEVPGWFHATFGVNHLERYGQFFIGSHGGRASYGYTHNATVESVSKLRVTGRAARSAIDFVQRAQNSLSHLSITPLPIDAYLLDVESTLKFLPRDWQR